MHATPKGITPDQKLNAMSMRVMGAKWFPKAGDFYTSALAELDLYRIVSIDGLNVVTENCAKPGITVQAQLRDFSGDHGSPSRVWVPNAILEYIA